MTPLRQKMIDNMKLRGFAPNTQQAYVAAVAGLAKFYRESPDRLNSEKVQHYLLHLMEERRLSWSTCNVVAAGLRFFYTETLRWHPANIGIPPRRKKTQLPEILSRQELERLFVATMNHKHRVMLMTAYGAGLRVSELVRMKASDIDSQRMMIRVEQGKGNKDRYTILSQRLLTELRSYWKTYRPQTWLFPSKDPDQHVCRETAHRIYHECKNRAGITKGKGIHNASPLFCNPFVGGGCRSAHHSDSYGTFLHQKYHSLSATHQQKAFLYPEPSRPPGNSPNWEIPIGGATMLLALEPLEDRGKERPNYEVADIFRQYGPQYRSNHRLPAAHLKVMRDIEVCRTAYLGGHLEQCDGCGFQRCSYNSCRNRHCPKCQALTKARWLEARKLELLPVTYFHNVFTLPHELNPLTLCNKKVVLNLLFKSVCETLTQFGANPENGLGGKLGFTCILHTWDQTLLDHFHLHCLIPGGALSADKDRWICAHEDFLFPVKSLSRQIHRLS
jgi:integrase/recombinase XerD